MGDFGNFLKDEIYNVLGISLREFARRVNMDPAYVSKTLAGKLQPPRSREKLELFASILKLEKGSEKYNKFFDLAQLENNILPDAMQENKNILEHLPAFFRTVNKRKPTREEFQELIAILEKNIDILTSDEDVESDSSK